MADIIIALDIGRKKTGVAIGNAISKTARPLTVVHGGRTRQLEQISQLINHWKPDLLVVGLPKHMDNTEHGMTKYARYFAQMVLEKNDIPLQFADERLTTQINTHPNATDADAATVILQAWLDGENQ